MGYELEQQRIELNEEISNLVDKKKEIGFNINNINYELNNFEIKKREEREKIDYDNNIGIDKKYKLWEYKLKELNYWRGRAICCKKHFERELLNTNKYLRKKYIELVKINLEIKRLNIK